jgi:hypothetical protein
MVGRRIFSAQHKLGVGTVRLTLLYIPICDFNSLSSYRFWLRIGLALIPDLLLTLVSLVLILNPMHHSTYSFHPVFALVTSFVMMSLYVNVSWLNHIVAMSREVWFVNADTWESLVLVETGFQGVLCIVWIVLVGYSCAAVHWWRKEKRGAAVKLGRLDKQGGLEN